VAVVIGVRIELKGNVDVRRLINFDFQAGSHHTDDFVELTAQGHPTADHTRITAEAPLPESVSQHRSLGRFRTVFLLSISAAPEHVGAAEAKEIGTGARGLKLLRRAFSGQVCHVEGARGDVLESRGLLTPEIVFVGSGAAAASLLEDVLKKDDPFGIAKRQRFQQNGFTTKKIAVLAPMPSASVAITTRVKPGVWRNMRRECLRSLRKAAMP
jgi:hypothetical protein